jgi:hypothetical protein
LFRLGRTAVHKKSWIDVISCGFTAFTVFIRVIRAKNNNSFEMKIRLATPADKNPWDSYVLSHPDSTHCHLFGWKEVIEKAYGHKRILSPG